MFKFDPEGRHMMPAHFGPRPRGPQHNFRYRDITSMAVPFITDRDKLAAYLPPPFEVAENAVVTVSYVRNGHVDFLAGHGYNMISVTAAVLFKGEEEQLEGSYSLVVWENLVDPILIGREVQGIPKIYADIQDHSVIDGQWATTASHFGHRIMDMTISDLREPTEEERELYRGAPEDRDNPMGWRFFPAYDGLGLGVSEFATFPSRTTVHEMQLGKGEVNWNHLTWEQNPTQHHIVNAIADLPVLVELPAMVARCSADLRLPERLPRVIR